MEGELKRYNETEMKWRNKGSESKVLSSNAMLTGKKLNNK